MGLTYLAMAVLGYACGAPLDLHTGWNAATRTGTRSLHFQMQEEDPYFTVLTFPCGPWGNYSRINMAKGGPAEQTAMQRREEQRPVLKLVNQLVTQRLKAGRHVAVSYTHLTLPTKRIV